MCLRFALRAPRAPAAHAPGRRKGNGACPVRFPFEEVCHVADRDRSVTRAG
jgi:hypothetical protein